MMKSKKSQSIFDFAIAIIAISGMIIGATRIWVWFNANYAKRQVAYQGSRLATATGTRPAIDPKYANPFETGYTPLDLTKEWVYRGTPSGTTGAPLDGDEDGEIKPLPECDDTCITSCVGKPGCGVSEDDFNSSCSCYQQCDATCVCNKQIKQAVDIFATQVISICGSDKDCDHCVYSECNTETKTSCGQACSLRQSAQQMRDAADKCDDPWEICWWGSWGKTSSELRDAARELDKNARSLERTGKKLQERSQELQNCCNNNNTIPFQDCLKQAEINAKCGEQCFTEATERVDACESAGGWFCESHWEAYYNSCSSKCQSNESAPCLDRINYIVSTYQAKINALNQMKKDFQQSIKEINIKIFTCNHNAQSSCHASCSRECRSLPFYWVNPECYNACYPTCYDKQRNICCGAYGPGSEDGWGRGCDTPATEECDSATDAHTPKCSLLKLVANMRLQITKIDQQVIQITQLIVSLPSCCEFSDVLQQNNCIAIKKAEHNVY